MGVCVVNEVRSVGLRRLRVFIEVFNTADLKGAMTLLDELA